MTVFAYVDHNGLHQALMQSLACVDLAPEGFIDYEALMAYLSFEGRPVSAKMYGSKGLERKAWQQARQAGFDVSTFHLGLNQAPKEVVCALVTDVVADAIRQAEEGDRFIVVAGGRDYVPAVRRLRKLGYPVTLMFFEDQASPALLQAATRIADLTPHVIDLLKPELEGDGNDEQDALND